jgi:hypothetical protein
VQAGAEFFARSRRVKPILLWTVIIMKYFKPVNLAKLSFSRVSALPGFAPEVLAGAARERTRGKQTTRIN